MYTTNLQVYARKNLAFRVTINAYWILIHDAQGNVVYKRQPELDTWLDPSHKAIADALAQVEKALLAAVQQ